MSNETKRLIHKSLWASSYQIESYFTKYYHYNNYSKIHSEVSLKEKDNDIKINLFFDNKTNLWMSNEPYFDFMNVAMSLEGNFLLNQLLNKLKRWETDCGYIDMVSNSWNYEMLPEMKMLLNHYSSPIDADLCIEILSAANEETFVHGDLIIQNVKAMLDKQIFICDFENACCGPAGWDASTFVYSLIEEGFYKQALWFSENSNFSLEFLYVIATVRLARSIKKGKDVEKRRMVFNIIKDSFIKKKGRK